jgi:hypothetical protein
MILLNVLKPSEEKGVDSTDSFYEELQQVFNHFPKYHLEKDEMGRTCGAYGGGKRGAQGVGGET